MLQGHIEDISFKELAHGLWRQASPKSLETAISLEA